MQTGTQEIIEKFSSHLFWDIDYKQLDWERHRAFIVKRVLEYGTFQDWNLLRTHISIPEIARISLKLRDLEPRALAFISTLSHIPREQFRCYTTKLSKHQPWNY